jgi:hypothetical protein
MLYSGLIIDNSVNLLITSLASCFTSELSYASSMLPLLDYHTATTDYTNGENVTRSATVD